MSREFCDRQGAISGVDRYIEDVTRAKTKTFDGKTAYTADEVLDILNEIKERIKNEFWIVEANYTDPN